VRRKIAPFYFCNNFVKPHYEENHVIDWDKAKVVDKEAQRQTRWIKRGTLDQEDTDVHESGCRILPTQPHIGSGDFQL